MCPIDERIPLRLQSSFFPFQVFLSPFRVLSAEFISEPLLTTFAPLTGCGLNPARDLGPRLVTWYAGWGAQALESWWVYTIGPLIGGVLGGTLYQASCAK